MSDNKPKLTTLDETCKVLKQSSDTQGISQGIFNEKKITEELPAKNSDEQDNISTSTSSCLETCNNLHNPSYPYIAR